MRDLSHVLLYTVDNDPEARLILLIALRANITTIRSTQPHGASFDNEHGVLELARAAKKHEIWTVELPGLITEMLLREHGFVVTPIDHHTYGELDRAHNPMTGERKKSSLEQFLNMTNITDDDLRSWGFDPRTVLGIGVMDDRFARGLRNEGFTPREMIRVLSYRRKLHIQVDPNYMTSLRAAKKVWRCRRSVNGYFICESNYDVRIAYALGILTIEKGEDEHPVIISDRNGRQCYANNLEPTEIKCLTTHFQDFHTFTYGSGRCWGIDNDRRPEKVTLEDVLRVLSHRE